MELSRGGRGDARTCPHYLIRRFPPPERHPADGAGDEDSSENGGEGSEEEEDEEEDDDNDEEQDEEGPLKTKAGPAPAPMKRPSSSGPPLRPIPLIPTPAVGAKGGKEELPLVQPRATSGSPTRPPPPIPVRAAGAQDEPPIDGTRVGAESVSVAPAASLFAEVEVTPPTPGFAQDAPRPIGAEPVLAPPVPPPMRDEVEVPASSFAPPATAIADDVAETAEMPQPTSTVPSNFARLSSQPSVSLAQPSETTFFPSPETAATDTRGSRVEDNEVGRAQVSLPTAETLASPMVAQEPLASGTLESLRPDTILNVIDLAESMKVVPSVAATDLSGGLPLQPIAMETDLFENPQPAAQITLDPAPTIPVSEPPTPAIPPSTNSSSSRPLSPSRIPTATATRPTSLPTPISLPPPRERTRVPHALSAASAASALPRRRTSDLRSAADEPESPTRRGRSQLSTRAPPDAASTSATNSDDPPPSRAPRSSRIRRPSLPRDDTTPGDFSWMRPSPVDSTTTPTPTTTTVPHGSATLHSLLPRRAQRSTSSSPSPTRGAFVIASISPSTSSPSHSRPGSASSSSSIPAQLLPRVAHTHPKVPAAPVVLREMSRDLSGAAAAGSSGSGGGGAVPGGDRPWVRERVADFDAATASRAPSTSDASPLIRSKGAATVTAGGRAKR
ncbi:hypothetical protein BDK51DRAFT_40347 [Blyttiomyces helicus]|uniref:Uncharacterized protein n=1 Tax=Blyttiomyces helicus TaxID=388810 RepID=A0A4P9WA64_9FUNG|nr:hypothetical protein BDK51DRAFT_40347 [Blyttiomyces helicus]|eukprot:RKO89314.1 hypothetical protein BDK51DRAFT_40347 [Blyttiomyces helicus]